jgi:HAD superfamily hydrolase (TIGR01509 family)
LFDLDGTLIDSTPLHELSFKEAIQQYCPELMDGFDYKRIKGQRTQDAFLALGITEGTKLTQLVTAKQAHYRAAIQKGLVPLRQGTLRLLELLRSVGRRMFIVTGASRTSAELVLETCGIVNFFEGIVSSDEVPKSKPHPKIFLHCLETYNLDRSASIVVEDALSGAIGAQAAGIDVVLVHDLNYDDRIRSFHDFNAFTGFLSSTIE